MIEIPSLLSYCHFLLLHAYAHFLFLTSQVVVHSYAESKKHPWLGWSARLHLFFQSQFMPFSNTALKWNLPEQPATHRISSSRYHLAMPEYMCILACWPLFHQFALILSLKIEHQKLLEPLHAKLLQSRRQDHPTKDSSFLTLTLSETDIFQKQLKHSFGWSCICDIE